MWDHCRFMCSIFGKVTQSFGFMKPNIIRKLPLKVKYISDINGDLIMHFGKFDDILKFVGMIVNDIERINSRKRNTINSSVFKVL